MSAPAPAIRPLAAILWAAAASVLFVLMIATVRHLGHAMSTSQAGFLRFALSALFLAPVLLPLLKKGLPEGTASTFFWRGLFHAAGVALWFYAIAWIPMAEVVAIGYLTPIVVSLGAVFLFGERMTPLRLLCLTLAILGGLIILRPGLRELGLAHFAQIAASIFFAFSFLSAKNLAARASPQLIVALMALAVTVFLAPLAIWTWQPVQLDQSLWILASAGFATAANFCSTKAYALAPLTLTQPISFLQLIWSTAIGGLWFGEGIDLWVMIGAAIILAAAGGILWSSAQKRAA